MGLTFGPWRVRNRCETPDMDHRNVKATQESIQSIAGLEIVFTGKHPDYSQADLTKIAIDLGARRVSEDLNQTTDILVLCGPNAMWKHGSYGLKEEKVAQFQRRGFSIVVIDGDGFLGLRSFIRAPLINPRGR